MVRKVVCGNCKGNRVISVRTSDGRTKPHPCPDCGGSGYKVEVSLSPHSR